MLLFNHNLTPFLRHLLNFNTSNVTIQLPDVDPVTGESNLFQYI